MPRLKSQIMEDFYKIASEAGLFEKEAYPSVEAYKNDPNARVGSDDLARIESLYNVDIDQLYNYDQTIMESAHQESVVIMQSYDKINGLVENNIERANIMHNLVYKPVSGNHTNHKYASQELTMELVRIANDMDSRDQSELFSLADNCLSELVNSQISKKALAPLAIAAIVGIPIIIGAIWLSAHTTNPDNGPLANADAVIHALKDLKENSWYESDVDSIVQQEADLLIGHIEQFKNTIVSFNRAVSGIEKPRSLHEKKELIKLKEVADKHADTIEEIVNQFKADAAELEPMLNQAIENFKDAAYQKNHTTPSTVSKMTGFLGNLIHSDQGLTGNDFTSAVNALITFKDSLDKTASKLQNFNTVVEKAQEDVRANVAKWDSHGVKPSAFKEVLQPDEDNETRFEKWNDDLHSGEFGQSEVKSDK